MFLRNCRHHRANAWERKKLNPSFNSSEGVKKGLKNKVVVSIGYVNKYYFSSRFYLLSLKLGSKLTLDGNASKWFS